MNRMGASGRGAAMAVALVMGGTACSPGGRAPTPAAAPAGDGGGSPSMPASAAVPPCPPPLAPSPAEDGSPPVSADARAGELLAPAWEIRPAPGRTLEFRGVGDADGNVYWVERLASGEVELASATRDGAVRFRAPALAAAGTLALAGSLVLAANVEPGACRARGAPVVEAYRASDGGRAWRRELLPAVAPWMRAPATCAYGGVSGMALRAGEVVLGVSILDADGGEHESGLVALDVATGEVRWTTRTSLPDNVSMAGAPRVAEDGTVYSSRRPRVFEVVDLLALDARGAIGGTFTETETVDEDPIAASAAILATRGVGRDLAEFVAVRCRATGELLARGRAAGDLVLVAADSVWHFGAHLSRHDLSTGALLWRVRLEVPPAASPGVARPLLFRSWPVVTRDGSVVFTEQQGTTGPSSSSQQLMPPVLRAIDGAGHEVLRRALPLEPEAYGEAVALHAGRVFVAGQVLPSANALGAVRAFDLDAPEGAREPAPQGWTTPQGSMARDQQAR